MENTLDYYTKLSNARELLDTLANNRARVLNELCRGIVDNTPHLVCAGTAGAVGTVRFNLPVASMTPAATLSSDVAKGVYDHLKSKRVPTFGNGLYIYVGNAKHFRGLKDEGVFQNFNYYNNAGAGIIYQVIGNWEGFTFVQTEEGMTGQYGYVIAPEIGAAAYAKPISLHYYPDINSDADRLNVIKWHMIAGFAKTLRDIGTRALKVYTL
jgi:hypothetical protein